MTRENDLLFQLHGFARLLRTEYDKRARAHGMTRAQWGILVRVERSPGLVQRDLAELLEVEPITVARLVDRLAARGMVERRADPADRRCWRLHLTSLARPLLAEIHAQLAEVGRVACDGVDPATLDRMGEALTSMHQAITRDRNSGCVAAPALEAVG